MRSTQAPSHNRLRRKDGEAVAVVNRRDVASLSTAQSTGMWEPYCGKSVQVLGTSQFSSRSTTCGVAVMSVSWQMP